MLRAFARGEMTTMVTMAGAPWLARVAGSLLACLPAAAFADDYADLVAAERAFAADAAARSVRDAFLTALGNEGVVFAPGPVLARTAWEPRPADTSRLHLRPVATHSRRGRQAGSLRPLLHCLAEAARWSMEGHRRQGHRP